MPTIPAVTSRSVMPTPAVRSYQNVRTSPADFGAVEAQSTIAAGQTAMAAAGDMWRVQQFQDAAAAAKAGAELRSVWSEELQKRMQESPEDPSGFRQSFEADFDAAAREVTQGLSDGARRRLETDLPTIRSSFGNRAGQFEFEARQEKAKADYETAYETEANALMRDETQLDATQGRVRDLIANSGMSPNAKARAYRRAEQGLTLRTYQGLIDRDPEKAKTWLEEGRHDAALDPGAKATLSDGATRAIEIRRNKLEQDQYGQALLMATESPAAAKAALDSGRFGALSDGHKATILSRIKEQERARRSEALADLRLDATEHGANLSMGAPSPGVDRTIAGLRALGDERMATRLEALSSAQAGLGAFQGQSFAAQQAEIARLTTEMQAGRGTPEIREKLQVYSRALTAKAEGFRTDPLATAAKMGMVELQPIPFNAPAASWVGTFQARAETARNISVQQGVPVPALTDAEASQITEAYERADTSGKVQILEAMTRGFGRQAPDTYALIFKKSDKSGPVLALSGSIAGSGADGAQVARDIVRGQGVLSAEGQAYLPSDMKDWDERLQKRMGVAYAGADPKTRDAIMDSIRAHYTAQASTAQDRSKKFDQSRLDKAIDAVTGGVLEFNGLRIPAPARGLSQRLFDDRIKGLTDDDLAGASYRDPAVPVKADDIRRFARLHAVGDGTYAVEMSGYALTNRAGGPFVLDLRPVMARARPAP